MDSILIVSILAACAVGAFIGWLLAKNAATKSFTQQLFAEKERSKVLEANYIKQTTELSAQLTATVNNLQQRESDLSTLKQEIQQHTQNLLEAKNGLAAAQAQANALTGSLRERSAELETEKKIVSERNADCSRLTAQLATANADNNALQHQLKTMQADIERLNKKFMTEFENLANKIFENKSEKFTALNKDNLTGILQPLGEKIQDFKKQVEDTYGKESNERASLKTEVKGLIEMNQQLAAEAKSLTRALKAEVKTQGRWGEMILEKILDKSTLRKGEEFFMEHQLFDKDGKALLSAVSGKKMRPDAIVKYPDERHVIIDAKVSINAFIRMVEAETEEAQQAELMAHVRSVKNHIDDLSVKAYDDYDKSMDFVMMFVPNEAAYFAALQGDANIWEYAYDRRILLISPTNLIAALKLLSDMWKRERNDKNATEIAARATKMYEKLLSFVESLDGVGKGLETAKNKYDEAYSKLTSGRDNFFGQAKKMKQLINYNKQKDFSETLLDMGEQNDSQ